MIKAIIFDLGGVLFTNGTTLFAKHIAQKHNKDQKEVYSLLNYSDIGNAYREGKMSKDEYWKTFKARLEISDETIELEKKWNDVYKVIEETRLIIEDLREKYKVYFLSDNVLDRIIEVDKKYGFRNWFHGGVFSHEVGFRKPHPKIYQITIEKIGLKPEEMLFIDDKKLNLPPAEKLGMHTLLFKNPQLLQSELKKMKLL